MNALIIGWRWVWSSWAVVLDSSRGTERPAICFHVRGALNQTWSERLPHNVADASHWLNTACGVGGLPCWCQRRRRRRRRGGGGGGGFRTRATKSIRECERLMPKARIIVRARAVQGGGRAATTTLYRTSVACPQKESVVRLSPTTLFLGQSFAEPPLLRGFV